MVCLCRMLMSVRRSRSRRRGTEKSVSKNANKTTQIGVNEMNLEGIRAAIYSGKDEEGGSDEGFYSRVRAIAMMNVTNVVCCRLSGVDREKGQLQ